MSKETLSALIELIRELQTTIADVADLGPSADLKPLADTATQARRCLAQELAIETLNNS